MRYFVKYSGAGRIENTFNLPDGAELPELDGAGGYLQTDELLLRPDSCYVRGGELVPMPQRPDEHHVFDYAAGQWTDPRTLADHQAAALRDCGAELTRRLYRPITVGGVPFDADPISRDRITGMILRLQQGRGLPPGWLGWRDADNAMHWSADSAGQVLASLEALSGAIENREQALLITGWTLKAQIEQATTVEQVQAVAWPA